MVFTAETIEKLRKANLGKHHSEETRKKISEVQKGKKLSEGHKKKMSIAHKGKKFTIEHRENIRKARIGIKQSEETLNKLSLIRKGRTPWNKNKPNFLKRGENSSNWKGGITPLRKMIRDLFKYRQWRSDIFTRDNFTCNECGKNKCWVEAHHIKPFAEILIEYNIKNIDEANLCEELWNINNGITLCKDCHNKTKIKLKK